MRGVQTPVRQLTYEGAIQFLRASPGHEALIRDGYLDRDPKAAAERFAQSEEFRETLVLLRHYGSIESVLDVGAGNGIATYAFARKGSTVWALEPHPSEEVGLGAVRSVMADMQCTLLSGVGEHIPLPDESVSVVYCRQVLHHVQDLDRVLHECRRVLKPNGVFLAAREHVVNNARQLATFLARHPVHQLAGSEHAYPLSRYLSAIEQAGLTVRAVLGPQDTIINAFPVVRSTADMASIPQMLLKHRFGRLGAAIAWFPGIAPLMRYVHSTMPGRMFTFIATR